MSRSPFSPPSAPPAAEAKPKTYSHHKQFRQDDFAWLRDQDNPNVLAYLEAENQYTEATMKPTQALQAELFAKIRSRINESDMSVPYTWGGFEYYSRTYQDKQYPCFFRRDLQSKKEECLLDCNVLAKAKAFFSLGTVEVSPQHNLLAFAYDESGDEIYQIELLDLSTYKTVTLQPSSAGNIVWSMDNKGFYYTTLDECQRPYQLWYHTLGTALSSDQLIFTETDERYALSCYRSKSDQLIIIELASNDTTELWLANAQTIETEFQCISKRHHGHEYYADDNGKELIIRTNDQGINFRLVSTSFDKIEPAHWQELYPHQDQATLEDFEPFANHLVLIQRQQGQSQLIILESNSNTPTPINFPDASYSVDLDVNIKVEEAFVRVNYESLLQPASVIDIALADGQQKIRKTAEVRGGFCRDNYLTQRLYAKTKDGHSIPISLVGSKEAFSQPSPLCLYGYGAYGDSLDPWFSHSRLNLLEQNIIFAIAHVRGGGDLGESWYRQGKLEHKENSFSDFILCLEYLQNSGITEPAKTVIAGGSAGGLLIGTVINRRPELCAAAVADVPFVDVLTTMLDPSLPLTITEYDEWGDPNEPDVYQRIAAYSPYDNVSAQHYPHLLITAGLHDSRVPY